MTDTKRVNLDELDEIFNASTQGEWVATQSFGVWLGPLKMDTPGGLTAAPGGFKLMEADHWDYQHDELEDDEEDVENRARANEACVAALHNNYKAMAEELRALRTENARLRAAGDDLRASLIPADHDPYEVMAPEDKPCPICEAAARYDAAARLTGQTPYEARITTLESQLEAAREEQGLEARLFELLTARDAEHSLQLRKHGVESWMGVVRCRDGKERVFECDESEGLPALLRAILEVERGS